MLKTWCVPLPKPSLGPGMITTFICLHSRCNTEVVNSMMCFGKLSFASFGTAEPSKNQQFYISVEQKHVCTSLANWRISPETVDIPKTKSNNKREATKMVLQSSLWQRQKKKEHCVRLYNIFGLIVPFTPC